MGGEAQNGQGPTQPSVERDWPMVPEEPAQESARAARGTESQVARPLCLLRHHRERSVIGAVPARGPPTMAQMAQPTGRANTDDVGAVCPCAERLSPPCGASRAQCVPLSSETIVRGAGCPSGASPDLWEPRVGNRPRPPGRCANPTYGLPEHQCPSSHRSVKWPCRPRGPGTVERRWTKPQRAEALMTPTPITTRATPANVFPVIRSSRRAAATSRVKTGNVAMNGATTITVPTNRAP